MANGEEPRPCAPSGVARSPAKKPKPKAAGTSGKAAARAPALLDPRARQRKSTARFLLGPDDDDDAPPPRARQRKSTARFLLDPDDEDDAPPPRARQRKSHARSLLDVDDEDDSDAPPAPPAKKARGQIKETAADASNSSEDSSASDKASEKSNALVKSGE